jgi:hypothetical protein
MSRLFLVALLAGACSSPASSVGIQIDQARQAQGYGDADDNTLQLSVTVTNAAGAAPIVLSQALFRIQTSSGLLISPKVLSHYRWIDGSQPIEGVELAGGGSYSGLPLAFDIAAGDAVQLVYTVASTENSIDNRSLDSVSIPLATVDPCTPCGAVCSYLDIDTTICCDGPTPAGGTCVNHMGSCPRGLALCDGACVDTRQDDANCGKCGQAVPEGGYCSSGTPSCGGLTNCWGLCSDVSSDAHNCGACGIACPGRLQCNNGKCDSEIGFANSPAQTCDAACASIGATCSDAGGFQCGYNGYGDLGSGNCGGVTGHDYDNSAIGGSKGIDWLGITCATADNQLDDYFKCHCVVR